MAKNTAASKKDPSKKYPTEKIEQKSVWQMSSRMNFQTILK